MYNLDYFLLSFSVSFWNVNSVVPWMIVCLLLHSKKWSLLFLNSNIFLNLIWWPRKLRLCTDKWSWYFLKALKYFAQWDSRKISFFVTLKRLNPAFLWQTAFATRRRSWTNDAAERDLSVTWLDKNLPRTEEKPTSFCFVRSRKIGQNFRRSVF